MLVVYDVPVCYVHIYYNWGLTRYADTLNAVNGGLDNDLYNLGVTMWYI